MRDADANPPCERSHDERAAEAVTAHAGIGGNGEMECPRSSAAPTSPHRRALWCGGCPAGPTPKSTCATGRCARRRCGRWRRSAGRLRPRCRCQVCTERRGGGRRTTTSGSPGTTIPLHVLGVRLDGRLDPWIARESEGQHRLVLGRLPVSARCLLVVPPPSLHHQEAPGAHRTGHPSSPTATVMEVRECSLWSDGGSSGERGRQGGHRRRQGVARPFDAVVHLPRVTESRS
jgi:hypothetical protein